MKIKTLLLYFVIVAVTVIVILETMMLAFMVGGGYRLESPSGYSMSPVIEHNDMVVYDELGENESVNEGDIVRFEENCDTYRNNTVVHTVKDVRDDGFITQGANNSYIDQYKGCTLPRENIEAKVAYVFPNPICDYRVSYTIAPQICDKPIDLS